MTTRPQDNVELRLVRERHRLKLERKRIHQLDTFAEIAFRALLDQGGLSDECTPAAIAADAYSFGLAMVNERDEHIEETDDDE